MNDVPSLDVARHRREKRQVNPVGGDRLAQMVAVDLQPCKIHVHGKTDKTREVQEYRKFVGILDNLDAVVISAFDHVPVRQDEATVINHRSRAPGHLFPALERHNPHD